MLPRSIKSLSLHRNGLSFLKVLHEAFSRVKSSSRCEEPNVLETNQHETNSNQLKEEDIMRIKYLTHFPVNQPTDEVDKYPTAQSKHCSSPSNSTKTIAVCTSKPTKAGITKIRLTWMVSGMNKHEMVMLKKSNTHKQDETNNQIAKAFQGRKFRA